MHDLLMEEIGTVSNYFEHVGAASIKLDKDLKVGDKIRIMGGEVNFEMEVKSMQVERMDVKKAKVGEEPGIIVEQKVRKGYKVFRV
jgi:ribosomal 50S subunit-recycling heat shock protein